MRTIPHWKLTRTHTARRLYEALNRLGVKLVRMHRYAVAVDDVEQRAPPDGVCVRTADPATVTLPGPRSTDELDPRDVLVVAESADLVDSVKGTTDVIGCCYLSHDRDVYVEPLDAVFSFDGAYIRWVFVAHEHRQRGIGAALTTAVVAEADHTFDADRVEAFIGADNVPSQTTIESVGFDRVATHSYYRLPGIKHRSEHAAGRRST